MPNNTNDSSYGILQSNNKNININNDSAVVTVKATVKRHIGHMMNLNSWINPKSYMPQTTIHLPTHSYHRNTLLSQKHKHSHQCSIIF